MDSVKEGILLGMGNPLLDISATVKPSLLTKHNLKSNDAILTEDEQIFKDLEEGYKVDYIAGGATQNSIRVAQWILQKQFATSYFGAVGKDTAAKTLGTKAREGGVRPVYQQVNQPTGRCAVLITGQDRSLVTKLDAANHFTVTHLENSANWEVVTAAQTIYSAGFFLTVSVESMLKVGKFCAETNRTYCLNLSAPFLIQFFKDQMMSVMPYADIVFGNETEATTFAEVHDFPTRDIRDIAKRISMLPKQNGSKGRLVVITQGSDPVVCVHEGKTIEYPAERLPANRMNMLMKIWVVALIAIICYSYAEGRSVEMEVEAENLEAAEEPKLSLDRAKCGHMCNWRKINGEWKCACMGRNLNFVF